MTTAGRSPWRATPPSPRRRRPEPEGASARKTQISPALVAQVRKRLTLNKPVRRTLPGKGRLHIDRQLPFLYVYRRPAEREDPDTERLVTGAAAYLVAPGSPEFHGQVSSLVRGAVETLAGEFGAFRIVELWAAPERGRATDPARPEELPTFTVHAPKSGLVGPIETLEKRLARIRILKGKVAVEVVRDGKVHPPEMRPFLSGAEARALNCSIIGLAVPPVYRSAKSQKAFPSLFRSLRRSLGLALRRSVFDFARSQTTHRPPHYHALGRQAVVKVVWEIDRRLAEVSDQFDYLLELTPVNVGDAFRQFRRERFERMPEFHYRPSAFDPELLMRQLYDIPIERVEDPALQYVFREKQEELALKIAMLRDRDTPRFLYESLQLFGGAEDDLLQLAGDLLDRLTVGSPPRRTSKAVDAETFAELARKEFESYRDAYPAFSARAQVIGDVAGLIVSRGKLLINKSMSVPAARVGALLAHEVGTHLVTYYNGRSQPFRQLYSGLAGYEELQEGLAVLAEYLVGGLSHGRMRQLAARVVAVRHLTEGASFVDTLRILERVHGFPQRSAYSITMRIYRSGGLTKDVIYLRGLRAILGYVSKGGDLEPLFVGKIAEEHIPLVRELQYRKVLGPAPIRPRYLEDPEALRRLEGLRNEGVSVLSLVRGGEAPYE
jgi:uncharacterized protein (TIGR02421 family)